jgi:hypothetical protein
VRREEAARLADHDLTFETPFATQRIVMVKSGTDLVIAKSAIADAIAGDACAFGPFGNDLADRDVEVGGAQAGVARPS